VADDIVTRFRTAATCCNHGYPNGLGDSFPAPTSCARCASFKEAADEIERLRAVLLPYQVAYGAVIAAGTAAVEATASGHWVRDWWARAIAAWEEVRRG
jgi:hypothetical protein